MGSTDPARPHGAEGGNTADRRRSGRRGTAAGAAVVMACLGVLLLAVLLLLPGMAGLGGGGGAPPRIPEASAPVSTFQSPGIGASRGELPAAQPVPVQGGPAAAAPQALFYPAAGIDVIVRPLEPTPEEKDRQTIIPPATMDGYWLTPYGMPGAGSTNTTYIAGHSWQDQDAPFNRLSTHAAVGDELTVATSAGELAYHVESVTTYVKSGLKDSPIWDIVPNRLVLISCYTDDLWGTNVVVVAAPGAASG